MAIAKYYSEKFVMESKNINFKVAQPNNNNTMYINLKINHFCSKSVRDVDK